MAVGWNFFPRAETKEDSWKRSEEVHKSKDVLMLEDGRVEMKKKENVESCVDGRDVIMKKLAAPFVLK